MKYFIMVLILIIPWTLSSYTTEEITNSVIESLKKEPMKWRHDAYKLYYFKEKNPDDIVEHRWDSESDLYIWIANGVDAIRIEHPQKVHFTKSEQEFIWKLYKKWANKFIAERVFDKTASISKAVEVRENKEQIINESNPTLSSVGGDKPTPVSEKQPCAFWQLVAFIEGLFIIVGFAGMAYMINRKK